MVERVLNIIHKEVRGLHQAAYVLAVFTFGSQILALVRDRLLAREFGAGVELDLYYTAFRIPDILYVLFASTLSVYVLIPFITERIEKESYEKARIFFSQIFSLFLLGYTAIAIGALVYTPEIVTFFFPGFTGTQDVLVLLIRILLLQPLLLGLSSLFGVITQMHHRFVLYAIGPLLYNIGIILGLIVLYPRMGISGLALGVVIGALGHVCIQLPYVRTSALMPQLVFRINIKELAPLLRTSCARALTLSLHQLVLLALIGLASSMTAGSVSVFQFAFNLQSVPLAIIGVSYSVAAFPLLAQLYAEKQMDVFRGYIINTLKHIFFWSLPVIALFIVVRAQFVRVVLGSGAFDWNDTRLTAAVLALSILSLTAQAVHLLMVRAFYAVGDTRTPFYVTLISSVCALLGTFYFYVLITSNELFVQYLESTMRLQGVLGTEVLALPLGYSTALIIHSCLILMFARTKLSISLRALMRPFVQTLVASLFAGYVAYVTLNYFVMVLEADTLLTVFAQGALAGLAGLAGFVVVQLLLKNGELQEVANMFKKRLVAKREIVAPQDEDHLSL
jgi:putative peptidoglycan lipid II flippase